MQLSQQTLTKLKHTWTLVVSSLTLLYLVVSYGGISGNKITAIAGESSTGKTFFALAVVRNFLDSNPDAIVVYFDTESAITRSLLEERDIDTTRVIVMNVVTIEEFRTKALQCVDKYMKIPEGDRQPMMFVLDSLGMLSTEKEIGDALD